MRELVERAAVEVDELGSWSGMSEESCEAGGRSGLEIPGRLDSRKLSQSPAHCCGGQWLELCCFLVSRWICGGGPQIELQKLGRFRNSDFPEWANKSDVFQTRKIRSVGMNVEPGTRAMEFKITENSFSSTSTEIELR